MADDDSSYMIFIHPLNLNSLPESTGCGIVSGHVDNDKYRRTEDGFVDGGRKGKILRGFAKEELENNCWRWELVDHSHRC
uniref:Uncharacterized protein n=1 Tax=Physcomitrium patens TaxID=3218 RepID=A0A2K1IKB1_PHYPA|nr:hypothetical protein PHYPA_028403 [Physcomitrium patens]